MWDLKFCVWWKKNLKIKTDAIRHLDLVSLPHIGSFLNRIFCYSTFSSVHLTVDSSNSFRSTIYVHMVSLSSEFEMNLFGGKWERIKERHKLWKYAWKRNKNEKYSCVNSLLPASKVESSKDFCRKNFHISQHTYAIHGKLLYLVFWYTSAFSPPNLATNETLTYFWINIFSFSRAFKLSLPFFSLFRYTSARYDVYAPQHYHRLFPFPHDTERKGDGKGSLTRENKSWAKIFFIFVMIKFICPQLVLSWMNTQHSYSPVHK